MEKFRIGLIGCGVISDIYLKTCQKLDILDVTACASLNIEEVKKVWPLAYDVRKEERLKGVSHYLSPKANLDNIRLSMYHSGSVPLIVGLHKDHVYCGDVLLKEVHAQIVGLGKTRP